MSVALINQRPSATLRYFPQRARSLPRNAAWKGLFFVGAHVPLALLMHTTPQIATIHALLAFLVGLRWALVRSHLRQVAYVGAYITGAEVLWRMTGANIPWEFGKYATGGLFVIALMRNNRFKIPLLPLLYFVMLLPAIIPTTLQEYLTLDIVRQFISANLSGPFALMACAWFFSQVTFTSEQFERLIIAIVAPSIGIGIITLFSTVTSDDLIWGSHSNFTTSGGFGPNQVSGALGLGALMAFLFLFNSKANNWIKLMMFGVMSFLAAQSALTFSRGGLFGALGAAVVAVFYFSRDKRARQRVLFIVALTVLVGAFVVLPRLDSFTGGALSARFESTTTTGRTDIVESDLRMWDENPVFGVGVGMSYFRKEGWKAAHTEFSRLLAEHGIFGLVALVCLLVAGLGRLLKSGTPKGKAITSSMVVWSFLFMLDKAMRLVAPSFTFGLVFATLQSEETESRQAYSLAPTGARTGPLGPS